MKKFRTVVALALLIGAGVISGTAFAQEGDGEVECDCWYPSTNKYGVFDGKGECPVADCWVKIN